MGGKAVCGISFSGHECQNIFKEQAVLESIKNQRHLINEKNAELDNVRGTVQSLQGKRTPSLFKTILLVRNF